MTHEDPSSSSSQAFDDGATFSRSRIDASRTRRLVVLYAAGFLLVATIRVLHDSGISSSSSFATQRPSHSSQLQVVFRQSLNGASHSYVRCRLGDAVAVQTVETQDETSSGSHEDGASTVAHPGSLGSDEKASSLEDDPFNQVEGSNSQRSRGEKASHRTPPSSRSRKQRSRSAQSARSKEA